MAEPDKRKLDTTWADAASHLFETRSTSTPELNFEAIGLTRDLPDADLEKLLDAMMQGASRSA